MLATIPAAAHATKRNRIIIPDDDGHLREFIILETAQRDKKKRIKSVASYIELKKSRRISPIVLEGQTVNMVTDWTLSGTGWQRGITEYAGIRKVTIEGYQDPYQTLKQLASLFGLELRFRIVVDGSRIVGRFVDLIKKRGEDTKKETRLGKDLIGVERIENSDIVTALRVLGPEQEDGTRLIVEVKNEEARQRWGRDGQHLWEDYEPSISGDNTTAERLTELGEAQLAKRINTTVQYTAETIAMEEVFGYTHEKVRLGDINRIIDTSYVPPLYLEARVIEIHRSISAGKVKRKYVLGDFIEYKKEDLMKTFLQLQILYGQKLIRRDTPPPNPRQGMVWVDTSGDLDVIYTWNHYGQKWEKATPTFAEEVGAYDKVTVDDKDRSVFDDSTWYTDIVSEEKKQEAIQHTNTEVQKRELAILRQATEPIGSNFTVGQLWLRTTDDVYFRWTGSIWKQVTPSIAQIAEKAGLDYVNGQLSGKASLEALADKADLTYVDGELISKANKADTYTKVEVDNAVDSRVSVISYNTDQNGVVQRFESAESRISQTEAGLTSKVSQIDFNAVEGRVSTAESTISQHASLIESKVSQSVYDIDRNGIVSRLDTAESTIIQQAGLIEQRVTTTTYNNGMAGKENSVLKQNTAPPHANGRLWLDTSKTPNVLMRSTGTAWVKATPTTAGEVGAYSSGDGATLAGRVTSAEGSIITQAGQIELKASQSSVETLTGRVNTAESNINLLSDEIELRVVKNGVVAAINLSTEVTRILSSKIHIDGNVTFSNNYDPTTKETPAGAQAKANAAETNARNYAKPAIDDTSRWKMSGRTTINGGQIEADTVTAVQINVNSLSAISADLGTVTAGTLNGVNINTTGGDGNISLSGSTLDSLNNSLNKKASLKSGGISFSEISNPLTDMQIDKDGIRLLSNENGLPWSSIDFRRINANTHDLIIGASRDISLNARDLVVNLGVSRSMKVVGRLIASQIEGNIVDPNALVVRGYGLPNSPTNIDDTTLSAGTYRLDTSYMNNNNHLRASLPPQDGNTGLLVVLPSHHGWATTQMWMTLSTRRTYIRYAVSATVFSEWQCIYSGYRGRIANGDDLFSVGVGQWYGAGVSGQPSTGSPWINYDISQSDNGLKLIKATRSHDNTSYVGTVHTDGVFRGWKEVITSTGDLIVIPGGGQINSNGGDVRYMRDDNNYIRINNGSIQLYINGVAKHTFT